MSSTQAQSEPPEESVNRDHFFHTEGSPANARPLAGRDNKTFFLGRGQAKRKATGLSVPSTAPRAQRFPLQSLARLRPLSVPFINGRCNSPGFTAAISVFFPTFRFLNIRTMQINGDAKKQNTFDAIVVGSGMSGGWAAKEFCEQGLKTLVLERGRAVKHVADYPTATLNPWDFPHRLNMPQPVLDENPVVARCYAFGEATEHFFVKDQDHPYVQEKPFDWIRAYQEGGKSLLWARQTQRWSKYEFEAPARDGFAVPWPISYNDLAPWYSYVEKFVGISGNRDGIEHLPDSEVLPPWELNCVEKHIQESIHKNFSNRHVIVGRCAHLTEPTEEHLKLGRGKCQARSLCERGCPFGGYFSANSGTLPAARRTGNMTFRPHAVVHSILYDEQQGKAVGVKIIDSETKQEEDFFARVIFVNAACLNSNLILLNSRSKRFPNGLGNDNGLLGHYVAFHNYRGRIHATFEGYHDQYYSGRRPTTAFMPSYRNVHRQEMDYRRGFMTAYSASREGWNRASDNLGADLKNEMTKPGAWRIFWMMQGETIPKFENHVRLSPDQTDPWGIPQLVTSVDYDDNDEKMLKDFYEQGVEMLTRSGCSDIVIDDNHQAPGLDIHEMGGVRMGADPKTSLLNKWNQFHACKNVFVTDGACMTSVGNQNPSLTFMAITARAANFAIGEMKKQNL
jgi:choline dehydrogenase-like flavoprotein